MNIFSRHHPGCWIPTLYLAQGLPYAVVTSMAGTALLDLGYSAADTAIYTALLGLPWALKPFWAVLVQRIGTRRGWVIAMQSASAVLMLALAGVLPEKSWLPLALALLAGIGFVAATHDIAADGFYIEALNEHRQAEWSGLRNTFFRIALLLGSGGLVWFAGWYEKGHATATAWTFAFALAALAMGIFAIYDFFAIPRIVPSAGPAISSQKREGFLAIWLSFVQKPGFWRILAFILLYRFAEGQVQANSNKAFFLAPRAQGGLGLGVDEVGLYYGTWGVLALMVGGILGGLAIARFGLGRMLWPMAAAMNLPNIFYVWMAWAQPANRALIGGIIFFEQFGYGFGFAAFMVYLLYVARGAYATAHYAICSALMAVGMALAGLVAAEALSLTAPLAGGGYQQFFSWVMLGTVVSFATLWRLPLERDFGRTRRPL